MAGWKSSMVAKVLGSAGVGALAWFVTAAPIVSY